MNISNDIINKEINKINQQQNTGDEIYNNFQKQIKSAMIVAGGKFCNNSKPSGQQRATPWWNVDCKKTN